MKRLNIMRITSSICLLLFLAVASLTILPSFNPVGQSGVSNVETMNNSSVIWMMICAVLVLFMQAGFLLLEAGTVRSKNSINVAQKNASDLIISGVVFFLFGHQIIFGQGSTGFFGFGQIDISGNNSAGLVMLIYHFGFCATAATIVSGAVAERMKFTSYLALAALMAICIYPVFAHMVWGNNLIAGNPAFLAEMGFIDFAGSTVVHATAAWVSLAAIIILGARIGRFDENGKAHDIKGNSSVLAFSGTLILFIGWIGFNAGAIDPSSAALPHVIANTIIAACFGAMVGIILGFAFNNSIFRPQDTMYGLLGGLVAITAGVSVVDASAAAVIGMAGGGIAILGSMFLTNTLKLDDPLDVVAIHGFAGGSGTLLLAFFAQESALLNGSRLDQFIVQLQGVGINFVWSFGLAFAFLKVLDLNWGIRISKDDEYDGLNIVEHGVYLGADKLRKSLEKALENAEASGGIIGYPKDLKIEVEAGEDSYEIATAFNTILNHNGKVISKLKTINDRTEAESVAKSEFFDNMGHEIRTPTSGVIGISELLQKTKLDGQQKSFVENIRSSASNLLAIINDMLDYNSAEANKLALDNQPFDIHDAANEVTNDISENIDKNSIQLIVKIDEDLPRFFDGDKRRYQQILSNLATNARKFTRRGKIEIEIYGIKESNENWLVKSIVKDTGIGIPANQLKKILKNSKSGGKIVHRMKDGVGLGLAISARLTSLMGGTFDVKSEVQIGSQFSFELPLKESLAENREFAELSEKLVGKRILLIDENAETRKIVLDQLAQLKTEHVACRDADEGIAFLDALQNRGLPLDAIIVDDGLPLTARILLMNKIKSSDYYSKTATILFVDGTSNEQMAGGVTMLVLKKPVSNTVLQKELGKVISASIISDKPPAPRPVSSPITDITPVETKKKTESVVKQEIEEFKEALNEEIADEPLLSDDIEQKNIEINRILISKKNENPLDVLIAEDNEVNRIIFAESMKASGLRYRIVENGEEAVAYFLSENPKVICMDVSMPVMDGLMATQKIREIEEGEGLPRTAIIGVTAHTLKGDREKCLDAGMDDYLSKPVSPEKLNSKITAYMEKIEKQA